MFLPCVYKQYLPNRADLRVSLLDNKGYLGQLKLRKKSRVSNVHMHDGNCYLTTVERMRKYKTKGLRGVIFLRQRCGFENVIFQYLIKNYE